MLRLLRYFGSTPKPRMQVTTRITTLLVGNTQPKPSFPTAICYREGVYIDADDFFCHKKKRLQCWPCSHPTCSKLVFEIDIHLNRFRSPRSNRNSGRKKLECQTRKLFDVSNKENKTRFYVPLNYENELEGPCSFVLRGKPFNLSYHIPLIGVSLP